MNLGAGQPVSPPYGVYPWYPAPPQQWYPSLPYGIDLGYPPQLQQWYQPIFPMNPYPPPLLPNPNPLSHSSPPPRPPDPSDLRMRLLLEEEERLRIAREKEAAFQLALSRALEKSLASFESKMQNAMQILEQSRLEQTSKLTSPPPQPVISQNPSHEPQIHSHLWKARCKQVALESTAATGGVKKSHRRGPGTIASLKTSKYLNHNKLLMRKPQFQSLVTQITQDFKTDMRFGSSTRPLLLENSISVQLNNIPASFGSVSDTSTYIPNLSIDCDGVDSVLVVNLNGIDEKLRNMKGESYSEKVKMDNKDDEDGVSVQQDIQGPNSGKQGRELVAPYLFDRMPKSNGLCDASRGKGLVPTSNGKSQSRGLFQALRFKKNGLSKSFVKSIRDKGGGLATCCEIMDAIHDHMETFYHLTDKIIGLSTNTLERKPLLDFGDCNSHEETKLVSVHDDIYIMGSTRPVDKQPSYVTVEKGQFGKSEMVSKKVWEKWKLKFHVKPASEENAKGLQSTVKEELQHYSAVPGSEVIMPIPTISVSLLVNSNGVIVCRGHNIIYWSSLEYNWEANGYENVVILSHPVHVKLLVNDVEEVRKGFKPFSLKDSSILLIDGVRITYLVFVKTAKSTLLTKLVFEKEERYLGIGPDITNEKAIDEIRVPKIEQKVVIGVEDVMDFSSTWLPAHVQGPICQGTSRISRTHCPSPLSYMNLHDNKYTRLSIEKYMSIIVVHDRSGHLSSMWYIANPCSDVQMHTLVVIKIVGLHHNLAFDLLIILQVHCNNSCKACDFGVELLFNILPLLIQPTLEDTEKHLLVKGLLQIYVSYYSSELVEDTVSNMETSQYVSTEDDIDLSPLNLDMMASSYLSIDRTTCDLPFPMILYSLWVVKVWHRSFSYLAYEISNYSIIAWFTYILFGLEGTMFVNKWVLHIAADIAQRATTQITLLHDETSVIDFDETTTSSPVNVHYALGASFCTFLTLLGALLISVQYVKTIIASVLAQCVFEVYRGNNDHGWTLKGHKLSFDGREEHHDLHNLIFGCLQVVVLWHVITYIEQIDRASKNIGLTICTDATNFHNNVAEAIAYFEGRRSVYEKNFASITEVSAIFWDVNVLAACVKAEDTKSGWQLWDNIFLISCLYETPWSTLLSCYLPNEHYTEMEQHESAMEVSSLAPNVSLHVFVYRESSVTTTFKTAICVCISEDVLMITSGDNKLACKWFELRVYGMVFRICRLTGCGRGQDYCQYYLDFNIDAFKTYLFFVFTAWYRTLVAARQASVCHFDSEIKT